MSWYPARQVRALAVSGVVDAGATRRVSARGAPSAGSFEDDTSDATPARGDGQPDDAAAHDDDVSAIGMGAECSRRAPHPPARARQPDLDLDLT
jgi:hypothetical protein